MYDHKHSGSGGASTFKAFGLTISSCIHFPELLPGAGDPDITVAYGELPQVSLGETKNGIHYQAIPGQLLLDVDRIARYLVRNGNEIVIDRHPDTSDDDVRLFLLGPALAAVMHQRGILTLHGSSVKVGDGCVVFLGNCRMGKSTLVTELVRRGYSCLGDDVCPVSIGDDGIPYASSAFPQAKLWLDSLQHFGIDPSGLRRIRPSRDKRCLPLERYADEDRIPVKRIYVLSRDKSRPAWSVTPMTGPPRIRVLRDYTYRVEYLQGQKLSLHHFKQVVYLASRLPLARVFCPRGELVVEKLASALESDFRS
jgi:hypothetical protein